MGSSSSSAKVEPKAPAAEKVVAKEPALDLTAAGAFQAEVESIVKASTHPKIKAAVKVLIEEVIPLLSKPGSARAIDDILTKELELMDCVDVTQLSDADSGPFRQARREFASLCSRIDDSIPADGHVRPAPPEAPTRKTKRRKSKK